MAGAVQSQKLFLMQSNARLRALDGKYPQDFEIDWLILSGSALTVFEIGMRGETEENPKKIEIQRQRCCPGQRKGKRRYETRREID